MGTPLSAKIWPFRRAFILRLAGDLLFFVPANQMRSGGGRGNSSRFDGNGFMSSIGCVPNEAIRLFRGIYAPL